MISIRHTFLLYLTATAAAQIPAFPGAEGAGGYAKGGRGGDVYHVTNLNASGAGSFSYGVTTGVPSAGRTVVFDVSGYAHISGTVRITNNKITIAGQTAPGDGFGLKDGTFLVSGDDIVIRHMRFRDGNSADSINLDSNSTTSIFDHCDAMFSNDENMSTFKSAPENLTFQWGFNAWGMESHSCGGLWDMNHTTCHHSLWAHNHTRNPKARPGLLDWVNNVTFDWDIGFILGDTDTPANYRTNVVGNYFIAGTSGKTKALEKGGRDRNGAWNFHVYLNNNRFDGNRNGLVDGTDTGWGMVSGDVEHLAAAVANNGIPVTVDDPLLGYKKIVSNAGPLRPEYDPAKPLRDEVANLLITETIAQTHHHVSSVAGTGLPNGGFGNLNSVPKPNDSDQDGIPDYFETAVSTGASGNTFWNSAADDHNVAVPNAGGYVSEPTFFPANTVAGAATLDKYTHLEEYLHYLAIPHGLVAKNIAGSPSFIDIDLSKFTRGFNNKAPVFTLANVVNGTVTQSGTGGYSVHFVPTVNAIGRAKFDFTVVDSDGSTWTQQFGILISASGVPRDLRWKGDGTTNTWDGSANNWVKASADPGSAPNTAFGTGDSALFDENGSATPAVNLATAQAPGSITVDSSSNYTISGAGSLTGSMSLSKSGTGTLTLSTANSFGGKTSINEGILVMGNAGALGSSGAVSLNGATLTYPTGGGTFSNPLIVNAASIFNVTSNSNIYLNGAISGVGPLTLNFSNKLLTFQNDWSGFSGTLDTGASTGNIRINSTAPWNFGAAVVNLGNAKMYHNVNGLFNITFGALNGGPSSQLSAGGQAVAGSDIYTIGGLNQDCLFAGAFADGGTGHKLAITKTGSGKLTLAGSSTHTGATTLSAGTLVLNGSLGATATTLASGTTLAGTGSSGGLITASSGSTISPGATAGAVGTLTSAGLTLAGTTTLSYDLSNSSVTGNDRITVNGGTLTLSSATVNFNVNMLNGVLASGTYNLIDGTAAMAANPAPTLNLVGLPAGARQTFSLARAGNGVSPGFVNLVVAGSPPASLVWSGANSGGLWDLNTTENFTGGATNTFYNLDSVTFDDTSTVGTVTLAGIVQPRTLTFSNSSRAYTLTGAGSIGGNTSLVKTGSATLTLESANTYTGGTTIGAGSTIQLANDTANAGALGTGPITMLGGTLSMFSNNNTYNGATYQLVVPAGQSGTFNADGRSDIYGTLTGGGVFNLRLPWLRTTLFTDWSAFTGTLNVINSASGGDLRMGTSYGFPGFPNAIVNLGAYCAAYYTGTLAGGEGTTISFGTLSGPSNSYLLGGSTGGRAITYRIGGRGTDAIFAGIISEQNTATSTSYVKTGTGMWTLGGSGAWNGGTTVEQGILKIAGSYTSLSATNVLPGATLQFASGSLTTDAVNIASGAFFSGNGIITGDLNNDGTVTSTLGGDLTVTGDVVNNGIMRIASGTSLTATGNFVNNGVLDLLTGAQGLPPNLENNGIVIDSSSLGMSGVSKSGNALTVSVPTYDGHFYQLQRSFSLNSDWADVGSPQVGLTTVAGAPTLRTFTDSSATADKGFYRVKVTP